MRVHQFTEQPYFPAWVSHGGSLRVNLPNARQGPKIMADLLHRYYDEWLLADDSARCWRCKREDAQNLTQCLYGSLKDVESYPKNIN
jgi:hypothetical protein